MDICANEKCTGCAACYSVCPNHAIEMIHDEDGFLRPRIDESKCVNCCLCKQVCQKTHNPNKNPIISSYIAKAKERDIVINSSSGGVFYELSRYIINHGGTVVGVTYDENGRIKHMATNDLGEVNHMQGSKYVQSDVGITFIKTRELLKKGNLVLFSGTPCQISGLFAYLGKDYPNLITVDNVCHGVPSSRVWNDYIDNISKQSVITKISFRDKRHGWNDYTLSVKMKGGKTYEERRGIGLYLRSFNSNISLRECCYSCEYKGENRCSDITLADAWGVQHNDPDMNDWLGTSLVLVHTEKGQNIIDATEKSLLIKQIDYHQYSNYNVSLYKSAEINTSRGTFFETVSKKGTMYALKKYCSPKIAEIVKIYVKDFHKHLNRKRKFQ